MGRNLDDVIKKLPANRQKKIAALSHEKTEEMIAPARGIAAKVPAKKAVAVAKKRSRLAE
ncbi:MULTISPECIES: hypothetical protein [unclassified Duganella]|uniref:hypothetical protein n=1 Tax=unclassified Duganella TaxID=2636909 RepID=UPI0011C0CE01|nr:MULTISPECIES: hypothetical protein [unclassified Duganella]